MEEIVPLSLLNLRGTKMKAFPLVIFNLLSFRVKMGDRGLYFMNEKKYKIQLQFFFFFFLRNACKFIDINLSLQQIF